VGTPGPLLDHWLAALKMYPDFVARLRDETGAQFEMRMCGQLVVATEEGHVPPLRATYERQGPAGVGAEWWTPEQVAAAEPVLPPTFGGLWYPEHGFVENRRMVPALAQAAARRGVVVRTQAPVARVVVDGARVGGVELASGERIAAAAVVNAAGAWSGQLGGAGGLPVGPSKGQMAALELRPMPLDRIVSFAGVTVVPRADGRLLLAATKEDDVGFDKRTTAWAVHHLVGNALRYLPRLRDASLVETWAGLRPRAADEQAVVGAGEPDGLYWATGHYGMGILSAPATAEALAGLLLHGESPLPIGAFAPNRFLGARAG
jgi:glycine oxidase